MQTLYLKKQRVDNSRSSKVFSDADYFIKPFDMFGNSPPTQVERSILEQINRRWGFIVPLYPSAACIGDFLKFAVEPDTWLIQATYISMVTPCTAALLIQCAWLAALELGKSVFTFYL